MLVRQKQQALFEHFRDVFSMFFFQIYKTCEIIQGELSGVEKQSINLQKPSILLPHRLIVP